MDDYEYKKKLLELKIKAFSIHQLAVKFSFILLGIFLLALIGISIYIQIKLL